MEERESHPDDDRLQAWAEDGLAGAEAEDLSRHLASCHACARHADSYRALFGDLAAVPATPPGLHAEVMDRIRREASARAPALAPASEAGNFWKVAGLAAAASAVLVSARLLDLPGRAWAAFPGLFALGDPVPWAAGLFERAGDAFASAAASAGAVLAPLQSLGPGPSWNAPALEGLLFFLAAAAGLVNLAAILNLRRAAAKAGRGHGPAAD